MPSIDEKQWRLSLLMDLAVGWDETRWKRADQMFAHTGRGCLFIWPTLTIPFSLRCLEVSEIKTTKSIRITSKEIRIFVGNLCSVRRLALHPVGFEGPIPR